MISMTRAAALAVILLCTIKTANAEDNLKDNKAVKTVPRSYLECLNVYPNDMLDIVKKGDDYLTSFRPMYVGYLLHSDSPRNDEEIKFQISFKYNLGKDIFLGYTQKSIWSNNRPSAPIKETDYSPELFYIHNNDDCVFGKNTWLPYQYLLFGFRHESNGVSGINSHGWNMVYIEPFFAMPQYKNLIISPSLWYPFASARNKELIDDIGIGKLTIKWQHFKLFQLSSEFRHGLNTNTYGVEGKIDFFIDPSKNWFSPTIFVQAWNGYGETLASHGLNTTKIIIGFSATR